MEDTLAMYGISIEEASKTEEEYWEYNQKFTDNMLYQKVVSELKKEIFGKFCNSDKDVAHEAYHEMQGLLRILTMMNGYESKYMKVQAIKEAGSNTGY